MELHNKKRPEFPDKDLINKNFGRWKVLEKAGHSKDGTSYWLCECECGNKKMLGNIVY